ncbi:MAG: hypothetical protein GAK43_01058 [Stenotrophomonas maltophilia]|nr:MAG: hypothetical protein GAK43_01058 [Stenotrophomonas maltophilia]
MVLGVNNVARATPARVRAGQLNGAGQASRGRERPGSQA